MAEFVKALNIEDIAPGDCKLVTLKDHAIVIFNVNGSFYALENGCCHSGGPLDEGHLDGETVECPWHGYQFDLKSGECLTDAELEQPTFTVKVEGSEIFVEV